MKKREENLPTDPRKIHKNKIEKNSGRRQISKLVANNQWGYLGMNTNKMQYKILRIIFAIHINIFCIVIIIIEMNEYTLTYSLFFF